MSLKDIERNLKQMEKSIALEVARTVKNTVIDISKEALPITPLLDGDLRESQRGVVNGVIVSYGTIDAVVPVRVSMENVVGNERIIEGSVSYDTDYALMWHEHEAKEWTTPGTGMKYLERPFLLAEGKYINDVGEAVRKVVNKKSGGEQ